MRTRLVLLSVLVTASTLTGCASPAPAPSLDPEVCLVVLEIVAAVAGEIAHANDADTDDEIDAYLDNAADAAGQLLNAPASPDFSERFESVHDALQAKIEALREAFHGKNAAISDDWEVELWEAATPVTEMCVE